ncbi:MAG: hypothetical protein KDJ48_01840 [Nitratireductor sp.]|nr:hypothetical protein [Nitratireductor sp.]
MAMAKMKFLTEQEVQAIAQPILAHDFARYGFIGSTIEEVEDFDGSYVFRLTANVEKTVPAKELIDTSHQILTRLREQGEDRFVILATHRPDREADQNDEDEG